MSHTTAVLSKKVRNSPLLLSFSLHSATVYHGLKHVFPFDYCTLSFFKLFLCPLAILNKLIKTPKCHCPQLCLVSSVLGLAGSRTSVLSCSLGKGDIYGNTLPPAQEVHFRSGYKGYEYSGNMGFWKISRTIKH